MESVLESASGATGLPSASATPKATPPATPPANPQAVAALIARLDGQFGARISARLVMPAKPARCASMPADLDPRLAAALESRGIARLYVHQREAWDLLRAGRHSVVVTPTASGKTLCYNLPVLQAVLEEKAKALYLFPTKALSQDQVAELVELNRGSLHDPRIEVVNEDAMVWLDREDRSATLEAGGVDVREII